MYRESEKGEEGGPEDWRTGGYEVCKRVKGRKDMKDKRR